MKKIIIIFSIFLIVFCAGNVFGSLTGNLSGYWSLDNTTTSDNTSIDSLGLNNLTLSGVTTGVSGKIIDGVRT